MACYCFCHFCMIGWYLNPWTEDQLDVEVWIIMWMLLHRRPEFTIIILSLWYSHYICKNWTHLPKGDPKNSLNNVNKLRIQVCSQIIVRAQQSIYWHHCSALITWQSISNLRAISEDQRIALNCIIIDINLPERINYFRSKLNQNEANSTVIIGLSLLTISWQRGGHNQWREKSEVNNHKAPTN